MRWDRGHQSSDVEDRRGFGPAGGGGGGLIGLLFMLFRWFGLPGLVIGILIFVGLSWCGGSGGGGGQGLSDEQAAQTNVGDEELASFTGFVLDDVQHAWTQIFAAQGKRYEKARLVLFTGRVDSACGLASSAVGPFYCPEDHRTYIDLQFYRQLRQRLGAPGDFAQAYVIAHELGHHVQNLQGNLEGGQVKGAGRGSVRTELQADCYAGIWAHTTRQRDLLETGDAPVEAIARQAGFGTVETMRRAFRRRVGVSPMDYRTRFRPNRDAEEAA